MAAVYVHLSGKDMDDSILKMHGIKIDDTIADTLTVGKCPRCHDINDKKASFCSKCGMPLNQEVARQFDANENDFTKTTMETSQIDVNTIKAILQTIEEERKQQH